MDTVIAVVLNAVWLSFSLWVAAKLTGNTESYKKMFVIALIVTLITLLPFGLWLGMAALLGLLVKWAQMEFWPDAVLTVVVSWGVTLLLTLAVLGLFRSAVAVG